MYDILNHTISPFSKPIKFDGPLVMGFVTKPHHHTTNPEGWGVPFIDHKGGKIEPGTIGGDKANWFLGADVKDSEPDEYDIVVKEPDQKFLNRDDLQVAGNIDWKGPQTPTHIEGKHKHIRISYNGPRSRYWAEPSFSYTDEDKFKEIYAEGKYLTIAPGPVLGACLSEGLTSVLDKLSGEQVTIQVVYVLAIIRSGKGDILYRRVLSNATSFSDGIPGVIKDKRLPQEVDPGDAIAVAAEAAKEIVDTALFDAWVAGQKKLYHAVENPGGWKYVASFPEQTDAYTADSPWFFNESGTEAQCMRKVDVTFNDGSGSDVTEMDHNRYRCAITTNPTVVSGMVAVFSNEGNEEDYLRFSTTETAEKTHTASVSLDSTMVDEYGLSYYWPTYANDDGFAHKWEIDTLEQDIQMYGTRVVAVDFDGDELLIAKARYSMFWLIEQYWAKGIDDPNPDPPHPDGFEVNTDDLDGPAYFEDNSDYFLPNNYRSTQWAAFGDDVFLDVYKNSEAIYQFMLHRSSNTGSPDTFLSGTANQATGTMVYVGQYTNLIRFADLRKQLFIYNQTLRNQYMTDDNIKVEFEEHEKHIGEENFSGGFYYEKVHKTTNEAILDVAQTEKLFEYLRTDMETWSQDFSETYDRVNITGEMTDANSGGAIYEPDMRTYYNATYWPFLAEWPTIEELFYEQDDKGGFGMDDADNLLYSVTTDGADGKEFELIVSHPDEDVESKFKASIDRLYDIGVV